MARDPVPGPTASLLSKLAERATSRCERKPFFSGRGGTIGQTDGGRAVGPEVNRKGGGKVPAKVAARVRAMSSAGKLPGCVAPGPS